MRLLLHSVPTSGVIRGSAAFNVDSEHALELRLATESSLRKVFLMVFFARVVFNFFLTIQLVFVPFENAEFLKCGPAVRLLLVSTARLGSPPEAHAIGRGRPETMWAHESHNSRMVSGVDTEKTCKSPE